MIESCINKYHAKGYCNKHYQQFMDYGKTFVSFKEQQNYLKETFHNNYEIITESGCWIWNKYCDRGGYGNFTYNKYPHKAHRWSYELYKGLIPDGLLVCHKCDIPCCVN